MSEFEKLLQENLVPLQRYVNFKISNKHDAEDIIQDVCLSATVKFEALKNPLSFKAWLIGIASHKCNDYYRRKANDMNISLEALSESALSTGRFRITLGNTVYDTVRLIDYENGNQGGMLCEYYLDKNGRTILWRRFNKNNWASKRYAKPWTVLLPDNERLTVNGETYVHWYDCVTDYIF